MHYRVKPCQPLQGTVTVPPSKSHTMRAILFASLAEGVSVIRNYLNSPDTEAMIIACRLFGALIKINLAHNTLTIKGVAGKPQTPTHMIDAGNSGQVLRFIAAISALTSGQVVITGDASCNTRPIKPLLLGLQQLGVFAESCLGDDTAPIIVKGPLCGGEATLSGEDSQPVSGLLIASAFATGPTTIKVYNPGEKPWIDFTLSWLDRLNIAYERNGYTEFILHGGAHIDGFDYTVPGDFSAAAFPLAAGLLTHSQLTIQHLDMHDVQGDKELIKTLIDLGLGEAITIDAENRRILVCAEAQKSKMEGEKKIIDVNAFIDALPILAVIACFARHEIAITNAKIARRKESDRISAITTELRKMGARIIECEDGLIIQPAQLKGAVVDSHKDHRIAMALTVAGLCALDETFIRNTECVNKSYPAFANDLQRIGADIEVLQ